MTDLIQRLQEAEGPDRELDEDIALHTGVVNSFLSKHRYWQLTGDDGRKCYWPNADGIPKFSSSTGEEIILTDKPWSGWAWEIGLPEYTRSLDAKLPGENIVRAERPLGSQEVIAHHQSKTGEIYVGRAKTEAIARRLAALMGPEINPHD